MFTSNNARQQTTWIGLLLAITMALGLAACGGGGGGGGGGGAAVVTPMPLPAREAQLSLSAATPTYAVGTITFTAATFTRESRNGDTFSSNQPYCAITVNDAVNGTDKYQVRVYFVKSTGAVISADVFDQRFSVPTFFGGYAVSPLATQVSVEPLLKSIYFNNAVFTDSGFGTSATVNGALYFGLANSTDVCGL